MPVGLALTLLGFVKLIFDIVGMNWHVAADTLLILFAAFQVIAIGLLADLVTRATRSRTELPPATAGQGLGQTTAATPASVRS